MVPLTRAISRKSGSRVDAFCDAVRLRDGRCVITGKEVLNAGRGQWDSFEAAHIFPLAYENYWKRTDFSKSITILPDNPSHGTINSVQNGLLLRNHMYKLFDSYDIAINSEVCIPYML